jgi:hypothetical protein
MDSSTWQNAVKHSQAFLSEEERNRFGKSDPEDIVQDFQSSQFARGQTSRIQIILRKIQPLVAAIERYGKPLDVIVNASPEILSPAWGTLRALLLVGAKIISSVPI